MHEIFSLKDRVVIITGGAGQLGRQFASAVQNAGGVVALFDIIPEEKTAELFQHLDKNRYFYCHVDVSDQSSVKHGIEAVRKQWGIPWGLVNNAGIDAPPDASAIDNGAFEEFPEETWNKVMDVNQKGVFLCSRVAGAAMAHAGGGSIVNIASIYGLVSPDQRIYEYRRKQGENFFKPAAYCVSKGALVSLTKYMATYWADSNVRVNCLSLGGVFNRQDSQFLQEYCKRVPMGRMAEPHEYNGAVIFLLSDASSYMTGSNIIIDGGMTSW